MGRLAPTKDPAVTRVPVKTYPCDRCGVSEIDGGHISTAKYEVRVSGGSLYLCGSHMRRHWTRVTEHGYKVVELDAAAVD